MKPFKIGKNLQYAVLAFVLTSSAAYAGSRCCPHGKVYLGVFGGYGVVDRFDVNQFGTAYYPEALGGPLAVNAFGRTKSHTLGFAGAHIGYQGTEFVPLTSWAVLPAAELEGFYLFRNTYNGHVINNTARIPEHDFNVSYPSRTTVFLTNAVFSINNPCLYGFQPYVGVGIGAGLVSISGAHAIQVAPAEPGINHYNSHASDVSPTFAGQVKLGLNYAINNCLSVFAEYRFLYLSSTHYAFGSTVFAGHPETSWWQVKLDPQHYNLGSVGIQFSF